MTLTLGPVADRPFWTLEYLYAVKGGQRAGTSTLAFLDVPTRGLPDALDAVVVAADLQGRELRARVGTRPRLLGVVVGAELAALRDIGLLPPADRTGVVLAGDLWAEESCTRRGGSGEVRPVWLAFRDAARWVVGVRGNHDALAEEPDDGANGLHVLDGTSAVLDGLRFAGVGGVIGNPRKPRTRAEARFLAVMREASRESPDVLVLHEGPNGSSEHQRGNAAIRAALAKGGPALVAFGHCHWRTPTDSLGETTLLNVDARVVVLRRADAVTPPGSAAPTGSPGPAAAPG